MLRRKIDQVLVEWKNRPDRKPLIISGARQIGKTTSIKEFGKSYASFIEINFLTMPQYKRIFDHGYQVEDMIKEISLLNPRFRFIPHDTLILFDEIQAYPDAATSLKSFSLDGRFDVICSGSLSGIQYKKISSIPVGYKEDYMMYSMDFEEFMWANGYQDVQIDEFFQHMKKLEPLSSTELLVLKNLYREYLFVGGMPEAVESFVKMKTFSKAFHVQERIHRDYEDDITNYVEGLDVVKVKNVYRHISSQLAKDNHKFQVTKLGHGARMRDYQGTEEWLKDAGIVNLAYRLSDLSLPLNLSEDSNDFRMYYADHGLFIADLDEEAKKDLIENQNIEIYNGALFESLVSEALVKSGYKLYYYRNTDSTVELDFVIRVKNEIVPIEVKRERGRSKSMNAVIEDDRNGIHYGVKLTDGNIGYDHNKFTFPYALTFLLKRFFDETNYISWSRS